MRKYELSLTGILPYKGSENLVCENHVLRFYVVRFTQFNSEMYFRSLFLFAQSSIIDVWQGSLCITKKCEQTFCLYKHSSHV